MKLSDLLDSDHFLCNATAGSLDDAMSQLARLIEENHGIPADKMLNALKEREKLGSFIVAPGIAFPHAREKFFDDFYVYVGLFPHGIPVENSAPVNIVVVFAVPMGKSNLYLRAMAVMSRLLSRPAALKQLAAQNSGGAALDFIAKNDEELNEIVTARDLMSTQFPFLTADASLDDAIKMMVAKETCDLPVVENTENMRYLGLITTGRLLKVGIPDYLMMMDNLNFIKSFEPFQDLLRSAQSTKVRSIIRRDAPHFEVSTPMFQVAIKLVESHTEFGVVVENETLKGTITRFDFIHKVVGI